MTDIQTIIRLLQSRRFTLSDEKRLQAEIEEVLTDAGIEHVREYRLDAGSIIDFFISGVGIEVKRRGSKLEIWRQLERYAEFYEVETLILVTNVPMGCPSVVKGKPIYVVNLAKAWL